jgi:purine-nucleoside phosphorylase
MRRESETTRILAAATALSQPDQAHLELHRVAAVLVLGSGLAEFASSLGNAVQLPFSEVPHWPVPRVMGHGANLVVGDVGEVRIACLTGRVHLYEGWQPNDVVRPVRTLRHLGVERFVLTNAAGGIDAGLSPGDLMVLTDHLNLTGQSPLLGAHEPELGPRFPDQTRVYAAELRAALLAADQDLRQGVYAGLLGPSYETPAEVRMLRQAGAHAVGMSTVHEAMALNAMGAKVAGISLISNLAAGIADTPLSHDDVIESGRLAADRFTRLLLDCCQAFSR